jgi:cell division protein FtsW (lipid II flippase)
MKTLLLIAGMVAYGLQALIVLAGASVGIPHPRGGDWAETLGHQIGICLPGLIGMAMFAWFLRIPKDRKEAVRFLIFGAMLCAVTPLVS